MTLRQAGLLCIIPPYNPYQVWCSTSGPYARKLREKQCEVPSEAEEHGNSVLRRVWTRERICDFETHQLTRRMRYEMLKLVRTYHSYIMSLPSGSWKLLDYTIAIRYSRSNERDVFGKVDIFRLRDPHTKETVTIEGISGEQIYEILSIMIQEHESA